MKKILYTATVVKTHVMQFHVPCLKMLQEMGWQTEVASKNDYEDPADCVIPCCDHYYDIPFERMPWNPRNRQAYRMLRDLIEKNHYDVIHCHTPVGALITRLAARKARKQGTKVVYTAHGFHFYKGAPLLNWLFYYPAEWLTAPLTDVLITINREDYDFARKHLKAKKILYIPGVGIDREKFCPEREAGLQKRQELGIAEDDFVMLTVAEMTKNKNHETILKALALLKDRPEFAHFQYLIVGRGQQREALETLASQLGIQDHVRFLGYRSDGADLCRASDLFLFMSFREGLSVALMEAMSSGLAVICTKIRGNTDLIRDGENGVFSENNPESLSKEILHLYENPDLRQRLGAEASASAERFQRREILKQMQEMYEDLF